MMSTQRIWMQCYSESRTLVCIYGKTKCQFFVFEVRYLGFKLDQQGLHPLPDKLEPILNLPDPTCVAELQSFHGMVQYYPHLLTHLASVLAPMYEKLKKCAIWEWGRGQQEAFGRAKKLLSSPKVLVHYSLDLPVVVSTDASSYDLGPVISHRVDGQDRPIAFASRTLTKAEKKCSQLDKEAPTLMYTVNKFKQYLCSRVHSYNWSQASAWTPGWGETSTWHGLCKDAEMGNYLIDLQIQAGVRSWKGKCQRWHS